MLFKKEKIIKMIHTNFHEKQTWIGNGHEMSKEQQVEIIKKHYADYDVDKDYVLWITADFYYPFTSEIQGKVQVRKRNGEEIEIPQVIRNPYPNKKIRQVSMKSGRKRLYGIPLVFHSFEELCEVNEVQIRWDFYIPTYLKGRERPLDLHVKNILIRYHLEFNKTDEENRFFTIYSQDYVFEGFVGKDSENLCKEYYTEFDTAIQTTGVIEMNTDKHSILSPMVSDIYDLTGSVKERESEYLNEKETEMLNIFTELKQDDKMIRKSLQKVDFKRKAQWEGYFYDRTEILKATSIAELLYM